MSWRLLGTLATVFFLVHGGYHVLRGQAHDLLWACNLASPLLAIGCLWKWRWCIAIPTLWLCFGTPLWLLDLATGGEFAPTSTLTHFGGLVVGLTASRKLAWPKLCWPVATAAMATLLWITRYTTAPKYNVNLAHAVWAGWEKYFPSYLSYFLALLVAGSLTFFVAERLIKRHLAPPKGAT